MSVLRTFCDINTWMVLIVMHIVHVPSILERLVSYAPCVTYTNTGITLFWAVLTESSFSLCFLCCARRQI